MEATTTARDGGGREKSPQNSHESSRDATLPTSRQDIKNDGRESPGHIRDAGESGRKGFDAMHFFRIVWRSSSHLSKSVNVLWPVVPTAIAVYYAVDGWDVGKFVLAYLAMIPCANLIGFAGQELARKMPAMLGVLTETTIASVVEIVLFMVLLSNDEIRVIQAAILGSILATMLLCLGLCFFASGVIRDDAGFDATISEAGSGLLLTAGLGMAVPAIFSRALSGQETATGVMTQAQIETKALDISRGVAILLLITYVVFIWFQTRTHHSIFDAIFEQDELLNCDRARDEAKAKLTLTESIVALIVSVALVTIIAIILVDEIDPIIEQGHVSDSFMGLILVPLVEKAAEHLTAIDEAWDNQMNFALIHCIGPALQTAMLNAPLAVIVGWGLQKDMSLTFEIFDIGLLILAIITVGNFLRDQKSNYLEGFLCVIVYVAIAIAAFYYPNPPSESSVAVGGEGAVTAE